MQQDCATKYIQFLACLDALCTRVFRLKPAYYTCCMNAFLQVDILVVSSLNQEYMYTLRSPKNFARRGNWHEGVSFWAPRLAVGLTYRSRRCCLAQHALQKPCRPLRQAHISCFEAGRRLLCCRMPGQGRWLKWRGGQQGSGYRSFLADPL